MKKILAVLIAALLVLGLCSCFTTLPAKDDEPVYSEPEESGAESKPSDEDGEERGPDLASVTKEELTPLAEAFAEVGKETMFADFSYEDAKYVRLYNPETDVFAEGGLSNPEKLVARADMSGYNYGELFDGCTVDPGDADCIEVKNFKSIAEIKENLSKYLDKSLYEEITDEDFFDFDGKVYAIRGGRGYGTVYCGDIIEYEVCGDEISVTAQRISFDEPDGLYHLTVKYIDGVLKITAAAEEEAAG